MGFVKFLVFILSSIPTFLGYYVLENRILYLALILAILLGNFIHIWGKELRENKLLTFFTLVLAIFAFLYKISLKNLPINLFLTAHILLFSLLITKKNFRRYIYIFLVSFLNLTVVSLYFQNLLYGLFLFFYLFLALLYFLVISYIRYGELNSSVLKSILKVTSLVYLAMFVFGFFLFFLLPRPQQPIFTAIHRQSASAILAFTNKVSLGEITQIQTQDRVVFRALIKPTPKDIKKLYWRANTLEIFDGNNWYPLHTDYVEKVKYGKGEYIQEILINPYGGKNVFSLDYPKKVIYPKTNRVKVNRSKLIVQSKKEINEPLKVIVVSSPIERVEIKKISPLLNLPENLPSQIRDIANKLKIQIEKLQKTRRLSKIEALQKVLNQYFSTFKYSLTNPAKNLLLFLKEYKEGNCEYFASATVVILRLLNIPSRMVIGFYGGIKNPLTGYIVVKQSYAHAWVEFYYEGKWYRYDPTIVAKKTPQIENFLATLMQWPNKLSLWWDTLNTLWIEYIVNLTAKKQTTLLSKISQKIEESYKSFKKYLKSLTWAVILISLAFLIIYFYRIRNFIRFCIFYQFQLKRILIKKYPEIFKEISSKCPSPIEIYLLLWKKAPKLWYFYKDRIKEYMKK